MCPGWDDAPFVGRLKPQNLNLKVREHMWNDLWNFRIEMLYKMVEDGSKYSML